MNTKIAALLISSLLLVSGSGCSVLPGPETLKINNFRAEPLNVEKVEQKIPRAKLLSALASQGLTDKTRIVQVYYGNETAQSRLPEYRIFDIDDNSVFYLLGLRNGDLLVAANDFVIRDSGVFNAYVKLLAKEAGGSIEIRRLGRPTLLNFTFVD